MVFSQRFGRAGKLRLRKIMMMGSAVRIEKSSSRLCVTGNPKEPSMIFWSAPGCIKPIMSAKVMLNITTIHNAASLMRVVSMCDLTVSKFFCYLVTVVLIT